MSFSLRSSFPTRWLGRAAEANSYKAGGGDFISTVASVGMFAPGRKAAQEPAGQNVLAGEACGAFAMAVDEAAAEGMLKGAAGVLPQNGIKGKAGVLEEGELEEKDKGKLDVSVCLSGISALLSQGAYHMQQDAVIAGDQTLSFIKNQAAEDSSQGQAVGGSAAGAASAVSSAAPEGFLPNTDAPGELPDFLTAKGSAPKEKAVEELVKVYAEDAVPEPTLKAAKEKSELDQKDFRDIQKTQAQNSAKAAQFVGNDSAREAVKLSSADFKESDSAFRGMAAFVKPDKEKEKPVQIPAEGQVMIHRTEQIVHAESAHSTQNIAPENTVQEENAAMQVARASVHALRRGMTEYRVRLSPEGLGDVEVTVVTKGKVVSLSMRTDNEVARGLILDHADELRSELRQQDYQVSGLSVEVGMDSRNGAGFYAPREHAEPVFDSGRQIPDQEAADKAHDHGPKTGQRIILPRSSTISYRV